MSGPVLQGPGILTVKLITGTVRRLINSERAAARYSFAARIASRVIPVADGWVKLALWIAITSWFHSCRKPAFPARAAIIGKVWAMRFSVAF